MNGEALWEHESARPIVWPGSPDARLSDPTESHEAADALTVDIKAASQSAVLDALRSVLFPMCDQEIARVVNRERPVFSESRLRTARHELQEAGRVKSVGRVKHDGARTFSRTWEAS